MDMREQMEQMGDRGVAAAREMIQLNSRKKKSIIQGMAEELDARKVDVIAANEADLSDAREAGISGFALDRIHVSAADVEGLVKMLRTVADLKDPIGATISRWIRPNGLEIIKKRVPIGVVGVVYESCPRVTADAAALCVKSSNAVILRGGSHVFRTNRAIAHALIEGGGSKGLPEHAVQFVEVTDHEAVQELVQLEGRVDLVVPRGGEGLIRAVIEDATVPVLKHCKGVCHVYIDAAADLPMAMDVIENAKCQRPDVCNAAETLLVHEEVAQAVLPALVVRLRERGVELRGDEATRAIVTDMMPADDMDWVTEYMDLVLSVKIVPSVEAAIDHINLFGSKHTDCIISESEAAQKLFSLLVDSSSVFINASTRFNDGAEFGMGGEIGICTEKLHARGPMGLEELTTHKYIVCGSGQVRE